MKSVSLFIATFSTFCNELCACAGYLGYHIYPCQYPLVSVSHDKCAWQISNHWGNGICGYCTAVRFCISVPVMLWNALELSWSITLVYHYILAYKSKNFGQIFPWKSGVKLYVGHKIFCRFMNCALCSAKLLSLLMSKQVICCTGVI